MSSEEAIAKLRKEYTQKSLDEQSVLSDPLDQFKVWFAEAIATSPEEPNAMALATVNQEGQPSVRMVLLKDYSARGFSFFTNYQSRKGIELKRNPKAALLFFWKELERQVRIEGVVEPLSRAENEGYFLTRPRGAQIGAHASLQSEALAARSALEATINALTQQYEGKPVPCPNEWGGYLVRPKVFEFWQGRESRLHDRLCYVRTVSGGWDLSRLYP